MLLEKYQRVVLTDDIENFYKIVGFEDHDRVTIKNIETSEISIVDRNNLVSAEIEDDVNLYGNGDSVFTDRLCIALNFMSYKDGKKKVNKLLKKVFKNTIYFIDIDRFIVVTKDIKNYIKDIEVDINILKDISKYVYIRDLEDPIDYFLEKRKTIIENDNMDTITIGELNSDRYKIHGMKSLLKVLSMGIKYSFRIYYIHEYFKYLKLKEMNND